PSHAGGPPGWAALPPAADRTVPPVRWLRRAFPAGRPPAGLRSAAVIAADRSLVASRPFPPKLSQIIPPAPLASGGSPPKTLLVPKDGVMWQVMAKARLLARP